MDQLTKRLQKYGRPNEATPAKWQSEYRDFNAPAEGTTIQPVAETTAKEDVLSAPPEAPNGDSEAMEVDGSTAAPEPANGTDDKKRKRHEGETPEEKAERKKRKKERKEKKEAKKAKKAAKAESSEEESE